MQSEELLQESDTRHTVIQPRLEEVHLTGTGYLQRSTWEWLTVTIGDFASICLWLAVVIFATLLWHYNGTKVAEVPFDAHGLQNVARLVR